MKRLILSTIMLMCLSHASFATKEVGNGGNVVFCKSGKISIELLDFYEARVLRGMRVDVNKNADPISIAMQAVSRLAEASPLRMRAYEKYIQSFQDEARFLSGAKLVPVNDSGHIFLPDGCSIVQIALQIKPEFPEDGRYVINKDLWDRMENVSKAGLILHEVIYREAIEFGASDSKSVRYLNALMAANLVQKYTPSTFNELMKKIGFKAYEAFGSMLVWDEAKENDLILDTSDFFAFIRPEKVSIEGYEFSTKISGGIFFDGIYKDIKGLFLFRYKDQLVTLKRLVKDGNDQVRFMKGLIPMEKIEFPFFDQKYTFFKNGRVNDFALLINQNGIPIQANGSTFIRNNNGFSLPGVVEITSANYDKYQASYIVSDQRSSFSKFGFPNTAVFFLHPTKIETTYGGLYFSEGSIDFNGGTSPIHSLKFYENGRVRKGSIVGNQILNNYPKAGTKSMICPEGLDMATFNDAESGEQEFEYPLKFDAKRSCYFD